MPAITPLRNLSHRIARGAVHDPHCRADLAMAEDGQIILTWWPQGALLASAVNRCLRHLRFRPTLQTH
jgi:hypothetical protein